MSRILQLFDCPIREIKEWLPIIRDQGFNYIQISPMQKNKVDNVSTLPTLLCSISQNCHKI